MSRPGLRLITPCWIALLLLPLQVLAEEIGSDWPREIVVPQGTVVIYQPQPEQLDGNQLKGRAAVSVEEKGSDPVFGVVWFDARLETDREARVADTTDLKITRTRFPNEDEKKSAKLAALLESEIPKWDLPIAMDELIATLDVEKVRLEEAEKINFDPPKILVTNEPSVLITIDGEPHTAKAGDSGLMRVINTAFTMLHDPKSGRYYLYAGEDIWYSASDWRGEWSLDEKVPRDVAAAAPEPDPASSEEGADESEPGPPPRIVVATEPTELIVINGKSEFASITGTDLLYLSNSESDLLMDIASNQYYLLLAGRWYTAKDLQGTWRHVPGDKLPKDFAKIPEDSDMGTVLYAVPGTVVAEEAALDAQIPQTATVDRKKAALTVEYDGKPEFENIDGTSMRYAVNTATPVIEVDKKYYAVDDAVWFVADKATGAWSVAADVPDVIYTIPADSPVYQVTFVKIYGATPEVVYVGYLPGYTGTYVYHTTIVYGTGYYWPGWYGRYYYPRPATWGFHVRWNPYRGWSFGLSYSTGPFTFVIGGGGWYRGGWWGPGRYRGYRRGYRHGHRAGYRAGYRAGRNQASRNNIYQSQGNKQRVKATSSKIGERSNAAIATTRKNNVFADRDGNVHRKTDQGWEQRTGEGWQSERGDREQRPTEKPQQKPQQQPSGSRTSGSGTTRDLERSNSNRQRGAQRSQSYQNSRSGGGRSGGRGGGRGGGGRR